MQNNDELVQSEQIKAALAVLRNRLTTHGPVLNMPATCSAYLVLKLAELQHEVFGILLLNISGKLIKDCQLFRGTLTHTSVYPREVVKEALLANANSVVLYHNHPSGDANPSPMDIMFTKKLKEALKLVDISVADHIIVAGTDTFSFYNSSELL
jgi:DNA repair protein RadC